MAHLRLRDGSTKASEPESWKSLVDRSTRCVREKEWTSSKSSFTNTPDTTENTIEDFPSIPFSPESPIVSVSQMLLSDSCDTPTTKQAKRKTRNKAHSKFEHATTKCSLLDVRPCYSTTARKETSHNVPDTGTLPVISPLPVIGVSAPESSRCYRPKCPCVPKKNDGEKTTNTKENKKEVGKRPENKYFQVDVHVRGLEDLAVISDDPSKNLKSGKDEMKNETPKKKVTKVKEVKDVKEPKKRKEDDSMARDLKAIEFESMEQKSGKASRKTFLVDDKTIVSPTNTADLLDIPTAKNTNPPVPYNNEVKKKTEEKEWKIEIVEKKIEMREKKNEEREEKHKKKEEKRREIQPRRKAEHVVERNIKEVPKTSPKAVAPMNHYIRTLHGGVNANLPEFVVQRVEKMTEIAKQRTPTIPPDVSFMPDRSSIQSTTTTSQTTTSGLSTTVITEILKHSETEQHKSPQDEGPPNFIEFKFSNYEYKNSTHSSITYTCKRLVPTGSSPPP